MLGENLAALKEKYAADLTIVNGENAAGGSGITKGVLEELKAAGADAVTSGNHIWDKKEIFDFIDAEPYLIRPANYPVGAKGKGFCVIEKCGINVGIVNLSGRTFMQAMDCPFHKADEIIGALKGKCSIIILDFHAETTSEKMAMGWHLDGRASIVAGTHTHIQTADERILPHGTAYITDLGMTGPWDSVIGVDKDIIVQNFLSCTPVRFEAAKGRCVLSGIFAEIDEHDGRARKIERIMLREE
jgi:hypothetical protein